MPEGRKLETSLIADVVRRLVQEANFSLPEDIKIALRDSLTAEESSLGRGALEMMLENADIAAADSLPICQDTGVAIVFIELGQDVRLTGAVLEDAVNDGVRAGYAEGYLRKSLASSPHALRKNTGDNTPACLHIDIVPGSAVKITVLIKGGGSESVGAAKVLRPAQGLQGIKDFVLDAVVAAGPNPCPPIVVGIGIGGCLDSAAESAKKAFLRPIQEANADPVLDGLERELKVEINRLGYGPAGTGGRITCLAVRALAKPSHIATLPVAVDISCYALRRKSETI